MHRCKCHSSSAWISEAKLAGWTAHIRKWLVGRWLQCESKQLAPFHGVCRGKRYKKEFIRMVLEQLSLQPLHYLSNQIAVESWVYKIQTSGWIGLRCIKLNLKQFNGTFASARETELPLQFLKIGFLNQIPKRAYPLFPGIEFKNMCCWFERILDST